MLNYLKAMAVFAAVVEAKSFTAAGGRLNMPRGKVSDQVKRLESYLGVKLLQRSTRSVVVTDEGQALFAHAKQLLVHGAAGLDEVKNFGEEIKGTIKITATHDYFESLLLPVLQDYKKDYPDVYFDLVITDEVVPVIDHSIDLAVRSGVLPDSSLISVPLDTTKVKLYASAQMDVKAVSSFEALEAQPWLQLTGVNLPTPFTLQHSKHDPVAVLVKNVNRTNSIGAYLRLLEQGYGIGFMAEHSAKLYVEKGVLQPVMPEWWQSEIPISLVYPARELMAGRTRLLIERIKSQVGMEFDVHQP